MSDETTETIDLSWTAPPPDAALEAMIGAEVEADPGLAPQVVEAELVKLEADGARIRIDERDAFCPMEELRVPGATGSWAPGQSMRVVVDGELTNGSLLVSVAKAVYLDRAAELEALAADRAKLPARISYPVRGGFAVEVAGTRGFLPGRESGVASHDAESAVGREVTVQVKRFDARDGELVLTRDGLWQADRQAERAAAMDALVEGAVVRGRVRSIQPFGAFVDIGGVDGLVHISEIGAEHVADAAAALAPGDEVEVKIVSIDREKGRIALSRREVLLEAASARIEGFEPGAVVRGRVKDFADFGAFVELDEGVQGLVHVSELSWTQRPAHASDVLSIGDEIEVKVLSVDPGTRRISLSLRATQANPWASLLDAHPVGSVVRGRITRIEDYGLFVEISAGIEGLCHVGELAWGQRPTRPTDVAPYAVGDELEVKIIEADAGRNRLSLSVKRLQADPWDDAADRLVPGTIFEATVSRLEDNAAWLEIVPGLEGRVHISEISNDRVDSIRAALRIGQAVRVTALKTERERRRVDLSIKGVETIEQADVPKSYQDAEAAHLNPLADALKKARGEE